MLTETVVELPHPAATVLLPVKPGARLTMVIAGALPLPPHAKFAVMWLLLVMMKPVTVTLLIVLNALKLVNVPFLVAAQLWPSRPLGPYPFHCSVLVPVRLLWVDWLLFVARVVPIV